MGERYSKKLWRPSNITSLFFFVFGLVTVIGCLNLGIVLKITITFSNYPATTAVRTFTSTVGATTNQFSLRGRDRQANLKIDTNATNANVRFGTLRLDIRPDGRR